MGVTFLRHWQKITVVAKKETIISAGSFKSPQILMLSGIGDRKDLEEIGVLPRVHLPGVGAELLDHPSLVVGPFVLKDKGLTFLWQRDHTKEAIDLYRTSGEGPLSSTLWSGYGLWSSNGNHSYPNIIYEQWAQGGSGMARIRDDVIGSVEHGKGVEDVDAVSQVVILGIARSRGNLKLASSDPFDQPLIDFNFFSDPNGQDLQDLVAAVRFIVNFYEKSPHFQKLGVSLYKKPFPGCEKFQFKSDEYYGCYVKMLSCKSKFRVFSY